MHWVRQTCAVLGLAIALLAVSAAAQLRAPEESVKAAFLYNFLRYTQWPAAARPKPGSSLKIGVIGPRRLVEELRVISASRHIDGHPVEVLHLETTAPLGDLNALFVAGQREELLSIIAQAHEHSILTVTDATDGHDNGAIISFVQQQGRLRFVVSLTAAEEAGLTLSSHLLGVALHVRERTS